MKAMKLADIIAPPAHPAFIGRDEDWELIERILAMNLPADYKKLVNIYGTGSFLKFLYVLSPFAPFDTSLNLLSGATKQTLAAYREGQKEFPQYSPPFSAYPDKTGLFPWAITVNGDTLFWLRKGEPDGWPVIVCDSKFTERFDRFECTAVEFLCRLFSGKIESDVFPDDLLAQERVFTPYVPTKDRLKVI
jgi:hypothetical protein